VERKAAQAYAPASRAQASRQKERARREEAIDKAQAALDTAEEKHTQRVAVQRAQIEVVEKKIQAEDADWDQEARRLKAALRAGTGLRSAGQECVNQPRFLAEKNLRSPLETFS
jgi:uncharacterized protein YjcR